jgi:hypothetical protein
MKMKLIILAAVLLLGALPLCAQAPEPEPQQQPPAVEEGEDTTTENDDLSGKVDSLNEAFTEAKSVLDALSKLKISGYIQAQYIESERSVNETSGLGTLNLDQFSVRRGRIKFTYQANPTARFVLQPDLASTGITLKDAYIDLIEPWTSWKNTLTAGQFKWPFGFEVLYSSSEREMPERATVVRVLFPNERDRGVQLSGIGFGEKFHYRAALVNGTGTNQAFDFNDRKDFVGRVGYSFGPLDVAVSTYHGADLVAVSGAPRGIEFEKARDGIDFQWVTPLPGFGVRGEYIRGVQPPLPNAPAGAAESDVEGWYVYAIQNIGTRHQFVVRVDEYDPDLDRDGNALRTIGGSYIFHWDANSKFMFAYEQPRLEDNDPPDNQWTVRYQFAF